MTTNKILTRIIGRDVYAQNKKDTTAEDMMLINEGMPKVVQGVKEQSASIKNEENKRKKESNMVALAKIKAQSDVELEKYRSDVRRAELEKEKNIGIETEKTRRQQLAYEQKEKELAEKKATMLIAHPPEPAREKDITLYRKGDKALKITGVPTLYGVHKGLQDFATPLTRNLSSIAGGALVGQFENPTAQKRFVYASQASNAYLQYLQGKYAKQGQRVNTLSDIFYFGTAAEQKRAQQLIDATRKAQQTVAGTGFLSGSAAPGIAMHSIPNKPLNEFTQVGTSGSYGAYGPETLSRLGVGQGLRAQTPENKFAALGIGLPNQDAARIASILGKSPDPLGKEVASEKIKRFTKF